MSALTAYLPVMANSTSSSYKISLENDHRMVAKTFRKGIKPEEVMAIYDEWSEFHEESINNGWYSAPAIALEEILRRIPPDFRATIRVLDVGAGTGWLGKNLYREGFKNIDALEPSEGMLKKLIEKGVYNNTFPESMGTGQCSIPSGTYDLVISSGGFIEGHLPVCAMDEFVRVSKKGAIVIFVIGFVPSLEAYEEKLEPYMEELERMGAWTKVERRVLANFSINFEGAMYIFRVA